MRALQAALLVTVVVAGGPAAVAPSTAVHADGPPIPAVERTESVVGGNASLERVGVWQAPADATDVEDAADVRAAIDDGTLSRATGVDSEDLLVIGIDVRGFEDAVANADGTNATERVRSALAAHGDLVVRQTYHGTSVQPAYVHVLDGPGVRAFPDAANGTYYLVVDLGEAKVTRDRDGDAYDLEYGPYTFRVSATLSADSPLTDDRQQVIASIEQRHASVATGPDGQIHLDPAGNQTISGTTSVGTGWQVSVVLVGEDDPATDRDESFRRERSVTVGADDEDVTYEGTFRAPFDLQSVPAGTDVTVDVRFEGRSLLDEPVPVSITERRASVEAVEVDTSEGFAAVTANASLSTGGFVVLHEGSADGPVVGHSAFLEAGEHAVEVHVGEPTDADEVVAVVHRDANHNEWFDGPDADPPFSAGDPADAVEVGPWAPTATPTATPPGTTAPPATDTATASPPGTTASPATDTATTPPAATTAPPSTGTPGSDTAPGFGIVAAVLALFVVLAVRRS